MRVNHRRVRKYVEEFRGAEMDATHLQHSLQLLHLDIFRRFLALVSYELVFDYCTLIERAQARPFHCGNMDEYIFATALRLHEAISLSRVEPLYGTCCH